MADTPAGDKITVSVKNSFLNFTSNEDDEEGESNIHSKEVFQRRVSFLPQCFEDQQRYSQNLYLDALVPCCVYRRFAGNDVTKLLG